MFLASQDLYVIPENTALVAYDPTTMVGGWKVKSQIRLVLESGRSDYLSEGEVPLANLANLAQLYTQNHSSS